MLVHEKIEQAKGILKEEKIDLWLTFVRESEVNPDPALDLILGANCTWQSAFIVPAAGRGGRDRRDLSTRRASGKREGTRSSATRNRYGNRSWSGSERFAPRKDRRQFLRERQYGGRTEPRHVPDAEQVSRGYAVRLAVRELRIAHRKAARAQEPRGDSPHQEERRFDRGALRSRVGR